MKMNRPGTRYPPRATHPPRPRTFPQSVVLERSCRSWPVFSRARGTPRPPRPFFSPTTFAMLPERARNHMHASAPERVMRTSSGAKRITDTRPDRQIGHGQDVEARSSESRQGASYVCVHTCRSVASSCFSDPAMGALSRARATQMLVRLFDRVASVVIQPVTGMALP